MKSSSVTVKLGTGLHARPATKFVQIAKSFVSDITIEFGDKSADAKSILSVLSIGIMQNNQILIKADGEDEEMAVATLCAFVMNDE